MLRDSTRRKIHFGTPNALLVEDCPRLQKTIGRQLSLLGFHVDSAHHYDAAICHLMRFKPELICVDVGLPVKSGHELCEAIRGPLGLVSVPILVMSDSGHAQDMAFAEAAGGSAFLCKPFSNRQLAECVGWLLDPMPGVRLPAHELAWPLVPLGLGLGDDLRRALRLTASGAQLATAGP
jgi:DNA-binding response OmpR family regulator